MPIDPDALLARAFPVQHQAYGTRDTILYALGVGLGADPVDPRQLRYVYEDALQPLPTLVNVLGVGGFWAQEADTGIDWRRLLHAEQSFVLHRPLPAAGQVAAQNRVTAIQDKGASRGALLYQEREITDAAGLLATVSQVLMLRGDGGCGSVGTPPPAPPPALPDRAPDAVCELPSLPQAALIYRLSGDRNPLHVDPAVAATAGFPRPILHGLCTLGMAGHAVMRTMLDYDGAAVRGMRVRFTAPVFPGETLRTEMWRDGPVISFRSRVTERDVVVLNAGRVDLG